jgi:hypothetical protein
MVFVCCSDKPCIGRKVYANMDGPAAAFRCRLTCSMRRGWQLAMCAYCVLSVFCVLLIVVILIDLWK